jgi:hypothetical protein
LKATLYTYRRKKNIRLPSQSRYASSPYGDLRAVLDTHGSEKFVPTAFNRLSDHLILIV